MEQQFLLKICIVGESGVGKTSMLNRYVLDKFDENSKPTLGCEMSTKIKSRANGKIFRLELWDIAGQERFNSISKMFLRGALGCIVVCSAQDENSLNQTQKWKKIIDENCDQVKGEDMRIPTLLVQNKTDLIRQGEEKEFQKKEYLTDFAKTHGFCGLSCCSAKDNTDLEQAFQKLLDEIVNRNLTKERSPEDSPSKEEAAPQKVTLNAPKISEEEKSNCC